MSVCLIIADVKFDYLAKVVPARLLSYKSIKFPLSNLWDNAVTQQPFPWWMVWASVDEPYPNQVLHLGLAKLDILKKFFSQK